MPTLRQQQATNFMTWFTKHKNSLADKERIAEQENSRTLF